MMGHDFTAENGCQRTVFGVFQPNLSIGLADWQKQCVALDERRALCRFVFS